jgi:hypothetical protein
MFIWKSWTLQLNWKNVFDRNQMLKKYKEKMEKIFTFLMIFISDNVLENEGFFQGDLSSLLLRTISNLVIIISLL